ncbi:SitI3 family protein [Nocardia sp. CA-107356]|uniref:SitI3 family protein n=1 Tax=Nocardia sp. CA-107356 TaxID=3239972 RepID=UPI003D936768
MSLCYIFKMAIPASVEDFAHTVIEVARSKEVIDTEPPAEFLIRQGILTRYGTWIRVAVSVPSRWGDPVEENFGFTPTVLVRFEYGKDMPTSTQGDDMVRVVSGLLERIDGDALLYLEDSESVWLLRRNGDLSLKPDELVWDPTRLAMITLPYRREDFHFS